MHDNIITNIKAIKDNIFTPINKLKYKDIHTLIEAYSKEHIIAIIFSFILHILLINTFFYNLIQYISFYNIQLWEMIYYFLIAY